MNTNRCKHRFFLIRVHSCLFVAGLFAADTAPKHYDCVRARSAIQVDGKLNDADWKRVAWTDSFLDIRGESQPKPRFRTRARMLWDDKYFYVAAEMAEPDVWATLTAHDSVIFHDNDFEV